MSPSNPNPDPQDTPAADAKPELTDHLVTTQHTISTTDGDLSYTAVTGRMVIRREEVKEEAFAGHQPKAEMSITSYTLDGADPKTRPVVFCFNGGPGSSSVWLHMGVLGPKRVMMGDVGDLTPPPYGVADNRETLLRCADLVFIDPVSTGFSRASEGEKAAQFHGYQGDLDSVAEVIRLWTTRNKRWLSPKFLAGESYGSLRSAALAEQLQRKHGLFLNGIALISMVINMSTLRFGVQNDLPYPLFLPTYAAIAHYHGKIPDRTLDEVLADAERFADGRYPWALAQGCRLDDEPRQETLDRLSSLTGLDRTYLDRVNLRPEHLHFLAELLRDEGKTVGRLDARFTGWDEHGEQQTISTDPSFNAIMGPYTAVFNHYVREELGFESDLEYLILSDVGSRWSYKEFEGTGVSVVDNLSRAMRANPHLQVHIAAGYYDCATPYYATDFQVAQLAIPEELRSNVSVHYYHSGHMMYLHEPSRLEQSEDLKQWVLQASGLTAP